MFYDNPATYLDFLPDKVRNTLEASEIAKTVNPEIDSLNNLIKSWVDNKSVLHADANGMTRWEALLGLMANAGLELEDRRRAAHAKLMERAPINMETLKKIVSTYLGVPVDAYVDDDTVYVYYRGVDARNRIRPLEKQVEKMIPASLLLFILYRYITWGEIRKQTWNGLRPKTWDRVRLGEVKT
ncbi:MAG: YmfQ family protein [Oscillospiraceae bacterium]|jgi:hypothetical protein|nr:YmfQ family protein [Oscillospiraceae bacterium]